MPVVIREAEPTHPELMSSLDEVAAGIKRLKKERALLLEAARFARSVLRANPVELSERMAIEKLDAAITLAEQPVP